MWARPQALVTALDREVQACQQAWINNVAPPVAAAAANVAPPVVVPAVAVPPVVPPPQAVPTGAPIAAATNVAPAVVAPPVAAPQYTKGPDGTPGWIAPSPADPNWTPPDETAGHYLDAEAVTTRRHNQGEQSDSSEEE